MRKEIKSVTYPSYDLDIYSFKTQCRSCVFSALALHHCGSVVIIFVKSELFLGTVNFCRVDCANSLSLPCFHVVLNHTQIAVADATILKTMQTFSFKWVF